MGLAQPAHSMIMLAAAAGCSAAGWARPAHMITVAVERDTVLAQICGKDGNKEETGRNGGSSK